MKMKKNGEKLLEDFPENLLNTIVILNEFSNKFSASFNIFY